MLLTGLREKVLFSFWVWSMPGLDCRVWAGFPCPILGEVALLVREAVSDTSDNKKWEATSDPTCATVVE